MIIYLPSIYYWTGLLILLDHSYFVGNLKNSKIAETKALEPSNPDTFVSAIFELVDVYKLAATSQSSFDTFLMIYEYSTVLVAIYTCEFCLSFALILVG
jgi:hypothetical protein